jgi:hypothetical protein
MTGVPDSGGEGRAWATTVNDVHAAAGQANYRGTSIPALRNTSTRKRSETASSSGLVSRRLDDLDELVEAVALVAGEDFGAVLEVR